MSSLLLASAGFIFWAVSIIIMYYSTFYSTINHIESASGYGNYIFAVLFIYACYRAWIWFSQKKEISFSFLSIIGIVLFHIFLVSVFYTGLPEVTGSPFMGKNAISSLTLFFHIIQLLLYPALLVLLTRSVGYSIGSMIMKKWGNIDLRIRAPGEVTIGFFVLSILLLSLGVLGMYTLSGLITVLVLMTLVGHRGIVQTYKDMKTCSLSLSYSRPGFSLETELHTFSIEFAFVIFTFLLSVSLINIIRPMPIGWDDLGVYMNFPKIIASTHEALKGVGMYAWQLITGTGFLFGFNASQAFYINQLGGILAVVFLMSILSYGLKNSEKKYLISLPSLLAVFYYAMPMTVFQQAKDMKLDPAYLTFALSSIGLLFYAWKSLSEKREKLLLIGIIGLIVGFSFSVKFTSLMLILGVLGWLSYFYASFWGYVGFFFLFLAIFTKFQLWGMMNVPMPKDMPTVTGISITLFISALVSFGLGIKQIGKREGVSRMRDWASTCIVFLVGVGVACLPWLTKNFYDTLKTSKPIAVNSLLFGSSPEIYTYKKIYTEDEIKAREKNAAESMTANGKSENEDLGRYFGYEDGLNNYLKLPANLTFQENQGGEFTDITYLFLALVPGLLLFVKGRREYTVIVGIGAILIFMGLYYFTKGFSSQMTNFFGQFTLVFESGNWRSIGYIVLILINLGIVALIHFATADTLDNQKLRDVSVFMGIYAFLFLISAFGIVWYGIVIYFGFFLLIGLSANRFLEYENKDLTNEEKMGFAKTLAVVLFIFIGVYFIRSAFPHAWNNLRGAYYNEYKYNILSQEESIFAYRSDYLLPIAKMNLQNISDATLGITKDIKSPIMKDFLSKTNIQEIPLEELHGFITKYRLSPDPLLKQDIATIGKRLYSHILYPNQAEANTGGIYRIGTFMTYLINKNNTRYFDDSLIGAFRDYFYDPSPEKTVERMKNMGFKYLLVDLNAATIDRDPRHDLTTRFEKLLKTMNAKNLKLISTDNLCLEIALSERKKGKLTGDDDFIDIAGTNYESYRNDRAISRNQKLGQCHMYIIKMINENRAAEYPEVTQIAQEVLENKATQDPKKLQEILARHAGQSWFAFFEILDTPVESTTPLSGIGTGALSSQSGQTK